jgi:hypothetical protein
VGFDRTAASRRTDARGTAGGSGRVGARGAAAP